MLVSRGVGRRRGRRGARQRAHRRRRARHHDAAGRRLDGAHGHPQQPGDRRHPGHHADRQDAGPRQDPRLQAGRPAVRHQAVQHPRALGARREPRARRSAAPPSELRRGGEAEFRKLAVRKGGRTVLLDIDDIVLLSARNKSTYAHTYENQYLVDMTLGELEEKTLARVVLAGAPQLSGQPEQGQGDPARGRQLRGGRVDRDETHIPVARRQVKHVPRGGRYLIRRLVAGATVALMVGLVCVSPAFPADERSLSLSASKFDFAAEPGQTGSGEVTVINEGDAPISVRVYAADQVIAPDGSATYVVPPATANPLTSPASWVTFELPPDAKSTGNIPFVDMPAGGRVPVKFQVTVPEGAAPGDRQAVLFFEMYSPPGATRDADRPRQRSHRRAYRDAREGRGGREGGRATVHHAFVRRGLGSGVRVHGAQRGQRRRAGRRAARGARSVGERAQSYGGAHRRAGVRLVVSCRRRACSNSRGRPSGRPT